jgi:putative ABC transport system permease protein
MSDLLHDVRYALRQMRTHAAFSFFIIATLAIGIGANTTIFGAANTLLLRPLPWDGGERLVRLNGAYEGRGDEWSVSLPNAEDWRERNRTFDDIAYYQGSSLIVADGGTPERLAGIRTSANLLPLLGARPLLGRLYEVAEANPDAERVVVLSYGVWQSRFGGAGDVLGRSVDLSGRPHTIIGVVAADFAFPTSQVQFYVPVRATASTWNRANGGLQVVGRLRAGVTLEEARADLARVSAQLAEEHPSSNGDLSAALRPLRETLYGGTDMRLMLYLLLGGVGLVLLIACVNVANLLLARATAREREIAVRAAIGAGRGRVLRQLLTESMLFAIAGGAAGVALAVWGTQALAAVVPPTSPLPRAFPLDTTVLAFTTALVLLTGVLFGLAPALHAARVELTSLLGGRTGAASRRRGRRRSALVVAEVALATVLLIGSGLMLRSMLALLGTDPGFRTDSLLTMRVAFDASYDSPEAVLSFQQRVLEELRALPGVSEAGAVDFIPLGGTNNYNDFDIEGEEGNRNAGSLIASPGYIEAMGVPLLRGRTLQPTDVRSAPGVVVISSGMAERYWPDADPIGRRILLGFEGGAEPYWRTIVGIVGDVRHGGLDNEPRQEFYIPFGQLGWAASGMTFALRTAMDPNAVAGAARDAVWRVDARQPVFDVRTMERMMRDSGAAFGARMMAGGLTLFAAVALLLAALGLYGVISWSVQQRTYEIGVRTALGARASDMLLLVLREGVGLVALGLGLGLAAALGLSGIVRSMLYGVQPADPLTFATVAGLLLVIAIAATLTPALRAARLDPLSALRAE